MNENSQGNSGQEKWFSVKTEYNLKYLKNNPIPFSREKSRQMGLVIPHKKVDQKVRSALGVPVILVPVIPSYPVKCQQGLTLGSLASVCIRLPCCARGRWRDL